MAISQSSRFAQSTRRLHSLKGGFEPSVSEELLQVQNIDNPVDFSKLRLRDEFLFNAHVVAPGVAAQQSQINFFPANPGDIMCVELVTVSVATAMDVHIGYQLGPPSSIDAIIPTETDTRAFKNFSGGPPIGKVFTNTTSQAGDLTQPFLWRHNVAVNVPIIFPVRWVIWNPKPPQTNIWKLAFLGATANVNLLVTIQGYTRSLEPSEYF